MCLAVLGRLVVLAGGYFISLAQACIYYCNKILREVFKDLNGNTKSARLVVTYVGGHTPHTRAVTVHICVDKKYINKILRTSKLITIFADGLLHGRLMN